MYALKLELPLILPQPPENLTEVLDVGLQGWAVQENVIKENDDKLP
jgi:hypothetical protein